MESSFVVIANSQEEYWRREFGATVIAKESNFFETISSLVGAGVVPIVQLDEDDLELNFLSKLPPKSIIGWAHSDESYKKEFNDSLSTIKSLIAVLRPYKMKKYSISDSMKSLKYTARTFKHVASYVEFLKLISWQVRGFAMQIRSAKALRHFEQSGIALLDFPIGYTNVFAKSYLTQAQKASTSNNTSLIGGWDSTGKDPTITTSFIGQAGQIVRELAVRSLDNRTDCFVLKRSGYGASNNLQEQVLRDGAEYFSTMFNSKFVLCPPGNISGESFRVFETLVVDSIPLVANHVTSDPGFTSFYSYVGMIDNQVGWGQFLDSATTLSEKQCRLIRDKNRFEIKQRIDEIRQILVTLTTPDGAARN